MGHRVLKRELYCFGMVGIVTDCAFPHRTPELLEISRCALQVGNMKGSHASPGVDATNFCKGRLLPLDRTPKFPLEYGKERLLRTRCFEAFKTECLNLLWRTGHASAEERVTKESFEGDFCAQCKVTDQFKV